MGFQLHGHNPAEAVEATFFRIRRERMADVPMLNPALAVEAVDLQRWQGHWLGVLVTPWSMSLLLLPGKTDDWQMPGENQRRFVRFPAGDFAFLGSDEEGLGEFQTCSLFSPMDRFASQAQAVQTARAALVALLQPPAPAAAEEPDPQAPASPSRRRFLGPLLRAE